VGTYEEADPELPEKSGFTGQRTIVTTTKEVSMRVLQFRKINGSLIPT
jgi:hypothetical protein